MGCYKPLIRGSPPHMRGKGTECVNKFIAIRITPAYAGKRCSFFLLLGFSWDHPRICGEKFNALPAELKAKGSPPHMRGKALPAPTPRTSARITPAYAGKSQWAGGLVVSIGDHPRICGEKPVGRGSCRLYRGSPPHMRGKERCARFFDTVGGITPAYAGKRQFL